MSGIQGSHQKRARNITKIAATCKHFYAYSLENSDGYTRHDFNAVVSKRDLAETYLVPFKACVAADVEQIMCSYNAVNGVPTCLDEEAQTGLLRGQWGYKGMIVSDCDAIADSWTPDGKNYSQPGHGYASNASDATTRGIKAGCDMDCGQTYISGLGEALSSGALTSEDLDRALIRIFGMRMRLGMFDEEVVYRDTRRYGRDLLDSENHRSLALQAAEESMVLLRNQDGLLPLAAPRSGQKEGTKKMVIGVTGPAANDTNLLEGGKNDFCPGMSITPLEGLLSTGKGLSSVEIRPCPECCHCTGLKHLPACTCNDEKLAAFAATVDVVVLILGGRYGSEGSDWTSGSDPS